MAIDATRRDVTGARDRAPAHRIAGDDVAHEHGPRVGAAVGEEAAAIGPGAAATAVGHDRVVDDPGAL